MQFCLHYYGPIRSNDNVRGKHEIRSHLHAQLKSICSNPPFLPAFKADFEGRRKEQDAPMFKELGGKKFWHLIASALRTSVDLSITFLFPYDVGSIVAQGGDIDNRIKTLFDALRVPQNLAEIPPEDGFDYSNKGMFCLLEDDKLISSVTIRAFQDHDPIDDKSCRAIIYVTTRITGALWGNLHFV